MDSSFIPNQVLGMTPASFCAQAQRYYKAEKMLMRQFILMKQRQQVPGYLSMEDMRAWLLAGQRFQEEFQETAKGVEVRKLVIAELAWVSARQLCLSQMEQELQEEIQEEERLTELFGREVTLEGLQMFLSVLQPKAEQDVRTFLGHLPGELLSSSTGRLTSSCSKLMLLTELQRATTGLAPQLVNTALSFLFLDDSLVEVTKKSSGLKSRVQAATDHVGELLADAAITCFFLVRPFTDACVLPVCMPVACQIVEAIHSRVLNRSKSFQLMAFDESVIIAREGITSALQDMERRAQQAACSWTHNQLPAENEAMMKRGREEERKRRVWDFLAHLWTWLRMTEE